MARIQFDISDKELQRLEKYIPNPKYRHGFAHKALMEWINRQEGRDKRVKKQDIGLVFDKLEDITSEVLDENYDRVKQNVDRIRPEYTMEKHIHRLESLINKLKI